LPQLARHIRNGVPTNVFCLPPSVAQHAFEALTCASLSIRGKFQLLTIIGAADEKHLEKNFGTGIQNKA
jgi:hypothetical protein